MKCYDKYSFVSFDASNSPVVRCNKCFHLHPIPDDSRFIDGSIMGVVCEKCDAEIALANVNDLRAQVKQALDFVPLASVALETLLKESGLRDDLPEDRKPVIDRLDALEQKVIELNSQLRILLNIVS